MFTRLRVDINIMVIMGDASEIMGYNRRTPELSNAPLHMKQDTLHQYREKYP